MPKGGARPGSGRKRGIMGKRFVTPEQREDIGAWAREYASLALTTLEKIARAGQSESAKVAASNSLLDRGYGKPKQTIDGTFNGRILVGWLADTLDLEANETPTDPPKLNNGGNGHG